jgi:hypothetical protein
MLLVNSSSDSGSTRTRTPPCVSAGAKAPADGTTAGDALAAGRFALGTGLSGYTLAAVLAGFVSLTGAFALVLADAKRL